MIRIQRLTHTLLDAWLVNQHVPCSHQRYQLRLWRESPGDLSALLPELRAYLEEAFDDVRKRLRRGFQDSLSPFKSDDSDPAANYPAALNRITLQGYFGEILGGLAAEHWGAASHQDWQVPAFLFRFHDQEFQHLELINQRIRDGEVHNCDAEQEKRPGRTGDDALAFRRNDQGIITDVLAVESKCLSRHRVDTMEEAHEKLNSAGALPPSIRELIELLNDYDTPEASSWQESLVRFRADGYRTAKRVDAIAYATAQIPKKGSRKTWLGEMPHPAYTRERHLEGMEFQFTDLQSLINSLYRDK